MAQTRPRPSVSPRGKAVGVSDGAARTPGLRPLVADSVLDLIGNTPLVRLGRLAPPDAATVLAKVESLNPAGSVKDRIALAMVATAEREGRLRPGATIVEP